MAIGPSTNGATPPPQLSPATVNLPAQQLRQTMSGGALNAEQADGSTIIDFDPRTEAPPQGMFAKQHDANLALGLDPQTLDQIGQKIKLAVEQDIRARENWENQLAKGIEFLGLKNEERTRPFRGASGVYDPMILEAVIRFQATGRGELLPAEGPVKTQIPGNQNDEVIQRAARIQVFMNLYLTEIAPEFYPEFDRQLFWLALHGSAFKKVYQDPILGRPVSKFIKAQDVIVPYFVDDIFTAPRVTHRFLISLSDIRLKQANGEYISGVTLGEPGAALSKNNQVQETINSTTGVEPVTGAEVDRDYTFYESHIDMDIGDKEAIVGDNGLRQEQQKVLLPYRVTQEAESGKVLAIYRNWEEGDDRFARTQFFVHYPFIPGMGFYGLGYAHILGAHARAATAIRRQAIDAATLETMPAGFRAKGARLTDNNITLAPLEFPEIETGGQPINNFLMTMPFKGPSPVMVQMLQETYGAAKNLASAAEIAVGEGRQDVPVGTTMALIEAATRIESGIMKRCHDALKRELRMIKSLIGKHVDATEKYPYQVPGGQAVLIKQDFQDTIDVIPVSDPNIASQTQRIIRAQALLTIAQQGQGLYDLRYANTVMLQEMGLSDEKIQKLLPPPQQAQPSDPLTENGWILQQKPVAAGESQDHDAHISTHMSLSQIPAAGAHIAEHMAMKMRVQVQQALGMQLPPPGTPMPPQVENHVATLVAAAMQHIASQQPGGPGSPNPMQTELQIQAMDAVRKFQEAQLNTQTDYAKALLDSRDKALDRGLKLDIAHVKANSALEVAKVRPPPGGRQ